MGSTPLGYCWFIYKIGARTGRLTGQFETYAQKFLARLEISPLSRETQKGMGVGKSRPERGQEQYRPLRDGSRGAGVGVQDKT